MSTDLSRLTASLSDRYRIEREIGVGGMATVYLAADARHDRKVAIKVLNPELGAVLGERFLSEIRVTAHLQHPNLLPLFDSGEADGLLFYVMPFVEGESLRHRLEREKQLSVEEAVRVCVAIASALAYAHQQGVIHRDLKPENILLQAGQPVVADFGIALAVSNAGGARVTQTGLSLGTPQYMSPEQASGDRAIDGRTDLYSLGCILYEMLIGDPPHTGSTVQAIVAKVLTERPPSVRATRPSVPLNVAFAVEKALEKLPADRWESATQFADALQGRIMPTADATATTAPALEHRGAGARFVQAIPWGIAAVSAAALAWTASHSSRNTTVRGPVRFTISTPGGRVLSTQGPSVAISPDGRRVAYVGDGATGRQLWVRDVDQLTPRPIPNTNSAADPAFSPDGRWIAFRDGVPGIVKKVALDGSTVVPVGSAVFGVGLTWTRGDSLVLALSPSTSGSRLYRMSANGGKPELLLPGDTGANVLAQRLPVAAPDGKTIFFTERESVSGAFSDAIAVTTLDERKVDRTGIPAVAAIGFVDGRLIYVQYDGTIMAVPFDIARHHATGAPVQTGEVVQVNGFGPKASLSPRGDLVYLVGSAMSHPVLVATSGATDRLAKVEKRFQWPRLSPDGTRLAVTIADGPSTDVWILALADGTLERLTSEGTTNDRPEWSRDGRRVLFRSNRDGSLALWWQPADGSAPAERLTPPTNVPVQEGVFSPDGKWLMYRVDTPNQARDIYAMPLDGNRTPRPFVATPFDELTPRFSRDGKWVAYISTESGIDEVYVRPFPGPGGRVLISSGGGNEPLWSHDGKRIFYRSGDAVISATLAIGANVVVSRRDPVIKGNYASDRLHPAYDVARDDQRFLMLQNEENELQLAVVLDWAKSIRARLEARK